MFSSLCMKIQLHLQNIKLNVKKALHLLHACHFPSRRKYDILQETSCSNTDYLHVTHQHGAVFLTCVSFKTRMIMMVGGCGWVRGLDDGKRAGRLRPVRMAVSGCSRLSEVDADNGFLDMPGLILSPQ